MPAIKLLKDQLDDLTMKGKEIPAEAAAAAVKLARETYTGLSTVLEQVRTKIAATRGDEAKAEQEYVRLVTAADKALTELRKKQAEGKLPPGEVQREMDAWLKLQHLLPAVYTATMDEIAKKRHEKAAEAADQIRREIAQQGVQTLAAKQAEWDAEIEKRALVMQREKNLTAANYEALVVLWKAGHEKLRREQAAGDTRALEELSERLDKGNAISLEAKHRALDAQIDLERQELDKEGRLQGDYGTKMLAMLAARRAQEHAKLDADARAAADTELARLGEQLQRIEHAHQTTNERIAAQYQADAAKFDAAEEHKALTLATSEADRLAIQQRFAAIRAALYIREAQDLQAFKNSTGWQAVFGANFASTIHDNENLSNEWRDNTERSHMLVRVAMESSKEQVRETFGQMADGMGSAIAQSLVYSKSIGAAMQAATKSTLESVAARDIVLAVDALAWGFYDIAMKDYAGAASAFQAAAIFGSEGVIAGLLGRAIPNPPSGATGAGAAVPSQIAARQANMQSGAIGAPAAAGQHLTINLYGPVVGTSGVGELCSMLSDAVLQGDHTLTATNTKTGVQVTR